MPVIADLALAALAAVALWAVGPFAARVLGGMGVLVSLVVLALGGGASWLAILVSAMALWLLGHLLSAYKNRRWHSRLAEAIVIRTPLLRKLHPLTRRTGRRPARRTPPRRDERRARPRRPPSAAAAKRSLPASPSAGTTVGDFELWEREMAEGRHERPRSQSPGDDG
ncbi:hypothetical protein [Nocardia nova]|uniref:hypothetical protein n=1 Tax=Nocardia nova TaxID=37330 RepID=UPI0033F2D6F1